MTAKDETDIEHEVLSSIETTKTDMNVIVMMITTAKGIEQNEHSGYIRKD